MYGLRRGKMRAALYDFDGTLRPGDSIVDWVTYARRKHVISTWEWLRVAVYVGTAKLLGRDRCARKSRALRFERGLTRAQIRAMARDFTETCLLPKMTREGLASWERDRREGFCRVLVSASTSDYMPSLARALGADKLICTQIKADGSVRENCRGPVKARRVLEWSDSLPEAERPDFSACRAYGNSNGDVDMLAMCGEPHLIGKDRKAIKACESRGIRVIRGFSRSQEDKKV